MEVSERKLGREKAWGLAHIDDKKIELHSSLKGKKRLEILIHEALHILNPSWSENKVIEHSKKMTGLLWKQKYRRTDQ